MALKIAVAARPPVAHLSTAGPGWLAFVLSLLGTFLVGTATALIIQLYVVPRVETGKRREDRWERNVLELGELLTTVVGERVQEVRVEQSIFRMLRQTDTSGPEFDQVKIAQGLAERARKAQQLTWAFDGLVRTRLKWLAERIISFQPSAIEIRTFLVAHWRYRLQVDKITEWSKDDDRTDDTFEEIWKNEQDARAQLIAQVNLLADLPHPPRVPRRRPTARPAGDQYDLLGGPDPVEHS